MPPALDLVNKLTYELWLRRELGSSLLQRTSKYFPPGAEGPNSINSKNDGDEAKKLLDSIDVSTIVGLRDRALIALLVYSFARVSAALHMNVEDY